MIRIVNALLCSAVLLLTPACDSDSSDGNAPINLEAEQMAPDAMNTGTTDLGVDDMSVADMGPADVSIADMGSENMSEAGDRTACSFILNCFGTCETEACRANCYRLGGEEGSRRLDALIECFNANMCEDDDCIEQNCADEWAACGRGEERTGTGAGCNFFFPCMSECTAGQAALQEECTQNCFGLLSAEAQRLFNTFNECINSNRCQNQTCIEENCLMEMIACIGD